MIGTKFAKPIQPDQLEKQVKRIDKDGNEYTATIIVDNDAPNTDAKYAEAAEWCNETQKATIEDMGDWYEVVAIPEPTPEEQAEQALAQAKAERADAVSRITVTVDGMIFDGDKDSQQSMLNAIQKAKILHQTEIEWILADNSRQIVSIDTLEQAFALAVDETNRIWVS